MERTASTVGDDAGIVTEIWEMVGTAQLSKSQKAVHEVLTVCVMRLSGCPAAVTRLGVPDKALGELSEAAVIATASNTAVSSNPTLSTTTGRRVISDQAT
jgi:hypothetical protein